MQRTFSIHCLSPYDSSPCWEASSCRSAEMSFKSSSIWPASSMSCAVASLTTDPIEPFSPPSFCRSGAGLQEYTYHYQKGYRQVTGRLYTLEQERRRVAA
jgi:hypothetical protein